MPKISNEKKRRIVELKRQGLSDTKVAKEVGVSATSVTRIRSAESGELPADAQPGSAPTRHEEQAPSGLRGELLAEFTIVGTMWATADPICGGRFLADAPKLADALMEQARRSESLMKWLTAVAAPGGWLGVVMALAPTGIAVVNHHVAPRIMAARARAEAEPDDQPQGSPLGDEPGEAPPASPDGETLVNPREWAAG